jgi:hypothetical protein
VDLNRLIAAFGKKVIVLHAGLIKRIHHARLELAGQVTTPDAAIRRLNTLAESLPVGPRKIWNSALERTLDIGIQAGQLPYAAEFRLAEETIKAIAAVNVRIVVTVYGSGRR